MKIKHYSIFNNYYDQLNWNKLRNSKDEFQYFLPYTKEDYILKVDTNKPNFEIQAILNFCIQNDIKKIVSIGSGIAAREYSLKKFSNIKVIVTDYDKSILRLKEFKIFDDVYNIDAINDNLPIDDQTLVIFSRIDTEFTDSNLSKLFSKCNSSQVNYIWFIPAELISLKIIFAEIKIYLISKLYNRQRLFCGYARSKSSFIKLWKKHYKIELENKFLTTSFILKKII
jgi:hypothetical protein